MIRFGFGSLPAILTVLCFALVETRAEGYSGAIQSRVLLKTDTTFAGQAIRYPDAGNPEVTALEILIPAGAETGWHTHPFPGYAFVLSGELTVEMEDGSIHRFASGQAVAESVGKIHNGRNRGMVPVKLVAFFTGAAGKPFTLKADSSARRAIPRRP